MANDSVQEKKPTHQQKAEQINAIRILADCTLKSFPFYYFQISLVTQEPLLRPVDIDALTVKKHYTSALTQRFGVMGSSIGLDILKLERENAWIRVPFEDRAMVTEALSGWNGNGLMWRIKGSGCWLGGVVSSNGSDLFND